MVILSKRQLQDARFLDLDLRWHFSSGPSTWCNPNVICRSPASPGVLSKNAAFRGQAITFCTPDALVGSLGIYISRRICFPSQAKIPESSFDAIRLSRFSGFARNSRQGKGVRGISTIKLVEVHSPRKRSKSAGGVAPTWASRHFQTDLRKSG